MRGLPAFLSNAYADSVQRRIKQRIEEKCRAQYWDELAEEGIVGISVNVEDGKNICYFDFPIWCPLVGVSTV